MWGISQLSSQYSQTPSQSSSTNSPSSLNRARTSKRSLSVGAVSMHPHCWVGRRCASFQVRQRLLIFPEMYRPLSVTGMSPSSARTNSSNAVRLLAAMLFTNYSPSSLIKLFARSSLTRILPAWFKHFQNSGASPKHTQMIPLRWGASMGSVWRNDLWN
jgi:hypothetical protein